MAEHSRESPGVVRAGREGQENLERSAALFRAVVESVVDGVITIDEHGRIESLNAAVERLFGYTQEELLGQNIRDLMPSPYREQHDDYLARYLATGEGKVIGNVLGLPGRRKDGSMFPIALAVSEVFFRAGATTQALSTTSASANGPRLLCGLARK